MNSVWEKKTILDFSSVLAGPLVSMFFAELGCRVIKVENVVVGGDVTRNWFSKGENRESISSYFSCCNYGKESVAVNLENESDIELISRLMKSADVVISNALPQSTVYNLIQNHKETNVDQATIYAQILGYKQSPLRPGFDAVIQAESGFMSMNGFPDGAPCKMPVALLDILCAHHLKEEILVSMIEQNLHHMPISIETSLFDCAIASLANQATNYFGTGSNPRRMGNEHPNIVPYGSIFYTRDNVEIMFACGTDAQYLALLNVLRVPVGHNLYSNKQNWQRVENRNLVLQEIAGFVLLASSQEIIERIENTGIPYAVVQTVAQALEFNHDLKIQYDKAIPTIRTFLSGRRILSAPPRLNEHGNKIRKEFLGDL